MTRAGLARIRRPSGGSEACMTGAQSQVPERTGSGGDLTAGPSYRFTGSKMGLSWTSGRSQMSLSESTAWSMVASSSLLIRQGTSPSAVRASYTCRHHSRWLCERQGSHCAFQGLEKSGPWRVLAVSCPPPPELQSVLGSRDGASRSYASGGSPQSQGPTRAWAGSPWADRLASESSSPAGPHERVAVLDDRRDV